MAALFQQITVVIVVVCYVGCLTSSEPSSDKYDGDKFCRNKEDCPRSLHHSPKFKDETNQKEQKEIPAPNGLDDATVDTHVMFNSIAAVNLYRAQIEIAQLLELAYLSVTDYPDISKQVRLTAFAARTQHMLSSGLMKHYKVSAYHIVKTVISMIRDAIDLEDADIVKDSFGHMKKIVQDMRKEAEKTRDSYTNISLEINKNIIAMDEKNKYVLSEQERLNAKMERDKILAENAKLAQEELEKENEMLEERMAEVRANRDWWMDMTKKTMGSSGGKTVLEFTMTPDPVSAFISSGVNFISNIIAGGRELENQRMVMEGLYKSMDAVEKTATEKRRVFTQIQEQRKDALDRFHNIKDLKRQHASLGDAETLVEAGIQLKLVDKHLLKIILFWQNMETMLGHLQSDTDATEIYLKKIEQPKHAERFLKSIDRVEKSWKAFGRICSDYVDTCENDEKIGIVKLYDFMFAPIKSTANNQDRIQEVEMEIEKNL